MGQGGVSADTLKARLAAGETLIGTFVKTPDPIIVEVLALTGLACLCLDAEHAPFDRRAIDGMRAGGARGCQGCGGAPARDRARACAQRARLRRHRHRRAACPLGGGGGARWRRMCRYAVPNGRGYAGSSRSAGYTTRDMAANLQAAAERTVVIAQIEDPEAIEEIDAIAQVDGDRLPVRRPRRPHRELRHDRSGRSARPRRGGGGVRGGPAPRQDDRHVPGARGRRCPRGWRRARACSCWAPTTASC